MGKDAEVFKLVANDGESLLNEIYTVHNTDTFGNDKVLKIKLLGNKRLGIRREKYRAYITCLDIQGAKTLVLKNKRKTYMILEIFREYP